MFHGTADPIVPFNSGYPFTVDIALPIVYGSNLIHEKLDELGIYHEFNFENGLLHEYWGTVNGNWFGGPNEYFDQINTDAFSFLYNLLDIGMIGDVNQDGFINITDVVTTVNVILNGDSLIQADVNNDGIVNVVDVILIVNLILE